MDFDSIERSITPKTRLLIINDLQNPTGAECSPQELERLAELVRRHDLYVLTDEAYFDCGTREPAGRLSSSRACSNAR